MTQCNTTATPNPNSNAAEAALRAEEAEMMESFVTEYDAARNALLEAAERVLDVISAPITAGKDSVFWPISGPLSVAQKYLWKEIVYRMPPTGTIQALLGLAVKEAE